MTKEELWNSVLADMEINLSRANFTTWFKHTSIISNNSNAIVISVPNGFVKEWLENKFNKQIFSVISRHSPEIRDIKYVVGNPKNILAEEQVRQSMISGDKSNREEKFESDVDRNTNLCKRYTFDSFVIGTNNELAYAASQAVIKNLGRSYNPLFIYGGVGLGKTHLMQSIGNYVAQNYSDKKILYISSERMTTEIVEAIKNEKIEELKQKYVRLDLLIVDDIQFIAGKNRTQEIFFATFNELYNKNKQIVLSSDRQPSAIPTLEARLRSRFEGGMVADIGTPDMETRLAILRRKLTEKNCPLDDECLVYIATNIQKNIRELEGALNRIIAFSQIYNKPIDIKEIKKLLTAYINTPYKKTSHHNILKSVADFFNIPITDLTKRSRKKEVVRPRQIAMYLLREETKLSFPEIGEKLGGRDHSTVIHAYDKIKKEEDAVEATKQELVMIRERIYQNPDGSII